MKIYTYVFFYSFTSYIYVSDVLGVNFFLIYLFNLFIFGCVGSSLLHTGFL